MARPIWNGTISFGLLNAPVQLFAGERGVDLHLRMLDARDQSPIRYERINSETGEIEAFVEHDAIDPRYFEKPYYLVPNKRAEKGYVLLREALKKTHKIGIAKVVIRTRQYLAAVLPLGSALILNLMRFPQELIAPEQFELPAAAPTRYRISPKEMRMAALLLESMVTAWRPADYKDDFRDKLRQSIDERLASQRGKHPKRTPKVQTPRGATTNVVDLMSLLKKSLAGKRATGAPGTPAATPRRRRMAASPERKSSPERRSSAA